MAVIAPAVRQTRFQGHCVHPLLPCRHMFDMLSNRNEWWVPGKIVELRERLSHYWKAPDSSRDLLLLDCALESWLRTSLERADLGSMEAENLAQVVHLVLRNAVVSGSAAQTVYSAVDAHGFGLGVLNNAVLTSPLATGEECVAIHVLMILLVVTDTNDTSDAALSHADYSRRGRGPGPVQRALGSTPE